MPLDVAEKYFIGTPFESELRLGDGETVKAEVFVAEVEIEGRGASKNTGIQRGYACNRR
jgi:predicted aspartyl protease